MSSLGVPHGLEEPAVRPEDPPIGPHGTQSWALGTSPLRGSPKGDIPKETAGDATETDCYPGPTLKSEHGPSTARQRPSKLHYAGWAAVGPAELFSGAAGAVMG